MTREEAIASYEKLYDYIVGYDDTLELDYGEFMELNHYIRSALRPVSREQVEKVWRGEWKHYLPPLGAGNVQCRCTKCGITPDVETPFCAWCGAPMTDEAVQTVMERLEALKNES